MNLDVLKGLLVLLVVVDHNDFSRTIFPAFLDGLGFHVVGFMALPFLRPPPALDRQFAQYLFRLYFPFVVFASACALAVSIIADPAPIRQLQLWLLSLYSGNSNVLKQSTHLAMLWYLPSFVALVIMRSCIGQLSAGWQGLAIGAACALHPVIGILAPDVQDYLPLGLLPALYVLPLAYAIVFVHERVLARLPRMAGVTLTAGVYIVVKLVQMHYDLHNEVGFADVADYTQPGALILNDLEAVTGVWMAFQLARLPLGALPRTAGKYSLQVYLFHPFIAAVIYRGLLASTDGTAALPLFCLSFLLTSVSTIAIARFVVEHHTVRRWLFPRNTTELASTLRLHSVVMAPARIDGDREKR